MPRVFNQKIKILYLMRIFLEQTDEEHPMSVKELISYLNSLGISAERKTVYDDIETLRNFGMDILNRREHPAGFYLASREFELPELRLLVDAVLIVLRQNCNFLNMGICHVAQGKIDASITSCNRHRCNRPLVRQFSHAVVISAGQNNSNCSHACSPSFALMICPLSRIPPG